MLQFAESGHPVLRGTSPFVQGYIEKFRWWEKF